MTCETCKQNGCLGLSLTHHDQGCKTCECKISHKSLLRDASTEVSYLSEFDKRPQTPRPKTKKSFVAQHKTFTRVFVEFRIIWFIFSGTLIGYAAGVLANPELQLSWWLPYLLLTASALFQYLTYRLTEEKRQMLIENKN